jgi:hypothetical protein
VATLNDPNVDIVEHAVAQCILAFSIKHDAGWSPAQFYRLGVCYCCLCCVRATLQSSFHCSQSLVDLCLTPQALELFVECWGVVVV